MPGKQSSLIKEKNGGYAPMGKVLSIYFSNTELRICVLEQKGKNVVVTRALDEPIPQGLVEDGVILEPDALSQAILKALQENRVKKGQIAFTILSKKIAQKEVLLPYVKDFRKVEEMVKANLSEYFPMNNLGDYVIRHNILDTVEEEGEKKLQVQVWAFPKPMIESYNMLADMIKMPLLTIDYYYNSVYQLLCRQMTGVNTTLAIQMSRHNTQVSIMKGKIQQFKRPIAYGRSTLVNNLMEFRNIVESDAQMALSDAQYQEHVLPLSEFQELIHNFAMSITRVAEYHTSKHPNVVIDSVKLFGTGACIPNFARALGQELGIDVEPVIDINGIRINKKKQQDLSYELLQNYMANIGVLFGSLDVKVVEEKKRSSFNGIMITLIVLAALLNAGAFGYFKFMAQRDLLRERKALESDIANLEIAEQFYQKYVGISDAYDMVNDIYKDTVNPAEMLPNFVSDLEEVMPATVGITNLAVQDGEVNITGTCGGKSALAAFVIELKKLPYVQNVWVASLNDMTDPTGNAMTNFTLSLTFVYIGDSDESAETVAAQPEGEEATP